jgi:hypothetical protein
MMRIGSRQGRSNSASESVWATARAKTQKAERDREKLRSPGSTLICRAIDLPRRLCHDRANQIIAGQGKQQFAGNHFRRLRLDGVQPHLFPEGQQIGLDIPALPIQRNYLFGRLGQSCEQIQVLIPVSGPRYDRPSLNARVGTCVRVAAPVFARGFPYHFVAPCTQFAAQQSPRTRFRQPQQYPVTPRVRMPGYGEYAEVTVSDRRRAGRQMVN